MGRPNHPKSVDIQLQTSSLIMKVMGFYIALAVCLLSSTMAAPLFAVDPIPAAAITASTVTLTSAAGVVTVIPTASILLGKALVLKGAALGALAIDAIANGDN